MNSVIVPEPPRAALAMPAQLDAERLVLRLLRDPAIEDAQRVLRSAVQRLGSAAMAGAGERLENAIQKWTAGILLREIAASAAEPKFLWVYDETPHAWAGFTFPGSACCGGNPDQIYRLAFLDGEARYEITGKLAASRPVQTSFEAVHGQPGTELAQPRTGPDVGRQISFVRDSGLNARAGGEFRILVGGAPPGDGVPHLPLEPGMVELTVREVLSDWRQQPAHLSIRRLDCASEASPPWEEAEIVRRAAADVTGFVTFWVGAFDRWVGAAPVNTLVGPVPRDGGWGFLADVHYRLSPDEAIVATLDRGGAGYVGLHITDPWTLVPDNRCTQPSLNPAQAHANADGSITYVIASCDPGVWNWIDTAGFPEGYVILRWIGTPQATDASRLVRRFEVVSRREARAVEAGPRVSADQRRSLMRERAADHLNRYSR